MPYVRVGTKRKIFLVLALINAFATTALLPSAFGTTEWFVETLQSRVTSPSRAGFTDSSSTTTIGLFQSCSTTNYASSCSSNSYAIPTSSTSRGCYKDSSDMKQRFNAVLTLLIFAFIVSVPNSAAALYQVCTSLPIGNSSSSRKFYFIAQVLSSLLSLACTSVAIAVFGDTFYQWIGCGKSYCSSELSWLTAVLPVQQAAQSQSNSQDVVFDCGYGSSIAFAIASLLSGLTFLILLVYNRSAPEGPSSGPPTKQNQQQYQQYGGLPSGAAAAREPASATPVRLVPEGPDWEFDDSTQLYWSPSQELFFDPVSGHFYDGATECWYDPNEKKWYKL